MRRLELKREEFTSPLLGAAFETLRLADERGERIEQATLLASFSPPEASHLTRVLLQPAGAPDSGRAVSDYIGRIRETRLNHGDDIMDTLRAVREIKQRKGTGYE